MRGIAVALLGPRRSGWVTSIRPVVLLFAVVRPIAEHETPLFSVIIIIIIMTRLGLTGRGNEILFNIQASPNKEAAMMMRRPLLLPVATFGAYIPFPFAIAVGRHGAAVADSHPSLGAAGTLSWATGIRIGVERVFKMITAIVTERMRCCCGYAWRRPVCFGQGPRGQSCRRVF